MAKMYIATVAREQHVIPSMAAYTATIRSFLPEQPLKMEMQWERVLPMERCRATEMAPTDLLPALTASMFIAIVHQEPHVRRLQTELSSAASDEGTHTKNKKRKNKIFGELFRFSH